MEIRNKFVGNYKTIGEETSEKISQYLSTRTTSDAAPRKHCSWGKQVEGGRFRHRLTRGPLVEQGGRDTKGSSRLTHSSDI